MPGGDATTRAPKHEASAVTLRRLAQHETLANLTVGPNASLSPVFPTRWHPQAWGEGWWRVTPHADDSRPPLDHWREEVPAGTSPAWNASFSATRAKARP